nr:hypothetical protein [uncultured Methanolobus sp.]
MWKCNRCGHANWMKLDPEEEDTCTECGKLRLRNKTTITDRGFGFFGISSKSWKGYWTRKAEAEIR